VPGRRVRNTLGDTATRFADPSYPMFVLPIPKLLTHRRLMSHQELLRKGELVVYDALTMKKSVVFVSHQWTSDAHPDPDGVQLATLKTTFQRLLSGKIAKVETNCAYNSYSRSPTHTQAHGQLHTGRNAPPPVARRAARPFTKRADPCGNPELPNFVPGPYSCMSIVGNVPCSC
jgi:hypothetical protein